MSQRIHRLDPATASRIAAGEVIERPTSVLKELLDNALDAGSTRIVVELINGGRQRIQVTDNGCGMSPEDAVLALQRFTTSKLHHIDDLQRLTTLGFRGEALPSIAAVADVTLSTRAAELATGVVVQSVHGTAPLVRPVGCPVGTRVCVQHLFAQVPVRLRGLKSVAREVQQMQELVVHYALAQAHVTFDLQHDGRRLLFVPASPDISQRLAALFGRDVALQMLTVHWQSLDIGVAGAVSPPAVHRASRQRQYIWVNGRPIRSGLVSLALERAYGAWLPPGRHPLAALGITLSPTTLDVNTHPRKSEITFLHERAIFAAVQEAVTQVLQGPSGVSTQWEVGSDLRGWEEVPMDNARIGESASRYALTAPAVSPGALRPLGQVGQVFIVASSAEGLVVLDQHAAHESILYTRLMAAEQVPYELEEPLLLALTSSQYRWLEQAHAVLRRLGLSVEPFGKDTMLVRTVPATFEKVLQPGNVSEAIQEAIRRTPAAATAEIWQEHLAAALACRSAYRAGDPLSESQIATLVAAVTQPHLAYTCPHGRPTYVTLSLSELERRFLRLASPLP